MQTLNEFQITLMEEDLEDIIQIIENTNDRDEIKYLTQKKDILIKELENLELTKSNGTHTRKIHRNSDNYKYS